jgi:chromosome partitioning protein
VDTSAIAAADPEPRVTADHLDPADMTSGWMRAELATVANVVVVLMRKGGAGKTTVTLLLADALARFGLSVLVIDMDPQGNSSIGLGREVQLVEVGRTRVGSKPIMSPAENTVCEVIESGEPGVADEAITLASPEWTYDPGEPFTRGGPLFPGVTGLIGLIPCYKKLEVDAHTWTPKDLERLANALLLPATSAGVAPNQRWDVVLIDTPPGGSLISVQAAKAAYRALFVTQPEKFGAKAVPETMELVQDIRHHYRHEDLDVMGLVLNEFVQQDRRTQRNITAQLEQAHRDQVPLYGAPLWGRIPDYTVVSDAQDSEAPVSAFLAVGSSRVPATRICQAAEAHAIRLLESIGHPQAADIKRAWLTAWPEELQTAAVAEMT